MLNSVKWDDKGSSVAIARNNSDSGSILTQAFANRYALSTTISSRNATFYSRSRSSLWTKGEVSNNFNNVHNVFLDCDRESIIYLGKPDGPYLPNRVRKEEADELCRTLEEEEDKAQTTSETGDVLYHAIVLMAVRGVKTEDVMEVLRKRFRQSGIE